MSTFHRTVKCYECNREIDEMNVPSKDHTIACIWHTINDGMRKKLLTSYAEAEEKASKDNKDKVLQIISVDGKPVELRTDLLVLGTPNDMVVRVGDKWRYTYPGSASSQYLWTVIRVSENDATLVSDCGRSGNMPLSVEGTPATVYYQRERD